MLCDIFTPSIQQSQSNKESLYQGQNTIEFVNAKVCDQELSDCFFETPHVTDPAASIFSLGFRKKTSPDRQIFHQVAPFCQDAVLTFSNDMRWECKSRTGEATYRPSKIQYTKWWEEITQSTADTPNDVIRRRNT